MAARRRRIRLLPPRRPTISPGARPPARWHPANSTAIRGRTRCSRSSRVTRRPATTAATSLCATAPATSASTAATRWAARKRAMTTAVRIDDKGISASQLHYLEMARRNPAFPMLIDLFDSIAGNTDIYEGREPLHPEWLTLFEATHPSLDRFITNPRFKRLRDFFDAARPYDPQLAEIDPRVLRVTFLLGAGASKPSPS